MTSATTATADIKLVDWTRDVYEPSDDSFLLVDALQARLLRPASPRALDADRGDDGDDDASGAAAAAAAAVAPPPSSSSSRWPRVAVELGCGSGYVITSLALLLRSRRRRSKVEEEGGPSSSPLLLLATDVSAPALASTARTLAAHGLRAGADVELVQGDLAEPLRARLRGAVDLLIFNPPYVPTPDDEVVAPVLPGSRRPPEPDGPTAEPSVGGSLGVVAAAWAGGDRGRRVVDRLLPQLHELLSEEGEAFVVAVQENDPEGMIRAAVGASEAAGDDDDGQREEEDAAIAIARRKTRRRAPLRGEVVLRRAADEEALCVLWFFHARGVEAEGGGGG